MYIRVLSYNLLSYVEENEWEGEKNGMYASDGDVTALRREAFEVMRQISV